MSPNATPADPAPLPQSISKSTSSPSPPPAPSSAVRLGSQASSLPLPVAAKSNSSASPPSPSAPATHPKQQPDALDLSNVVVGPSLSPPTHPGIGAPPMKDRSVSASTNRSQGGGVNSTGHAYMSVSPSHRLGSRSPTSIPSSPTSIHSASSAIFERDIEPPPFATLPHPHSSHPSNPHRTPRSKATESIEASVPSVLDSAATLLATSDASNDIDVAVEAPMPLLSSAASVTGRAPLGSTSPVGRGSRSPSPATSGGRGRTSMILNLPSPAQGSITLPGGSASPTSSGGRSPPTGSPNKAPPPFNATLPAGSPTGEVTMPGSFGRRSAASPPPPLTAISQTSSEGETVYEDAVSGGSDDGTAEDGDAPPRTATNEKPPKPLPLSASQPSPTTPTAASILHSHSQPQQQSPSQSQTQIPSPISNTGMSYPPSPSHGSAAQKRLSFLAYADVRAGAPISTRPLSALTFSAPMPGAGSASPGSTGSSAAPETPPHLPAVEGALETVGVIEPSSASVLGMTFGPAYGSRSASAATSARNSLVIDALPLPPASLLSGISGGPGGPLPQAHAMGARPHSVYAHGAAADVKEPGSELEFEEAMDGSSAFGSSMAGGEWEREGMGRGLEERLEAVLVGGGGKI